MKPDPLAYSPAKLTTIDDLAEFIGVSKEELLYLVKNSSRHYKTEPVLKPNGDIRMLRKPSQQLKSVQEMILRRILNGIPLNPYVFGLMRGRGIVENALRHIKRPYLAHFDIKDFFPSITSQRVHQIFRDAGLKTQVASVLVSLTTTDNQLPQGAPSSNRIAGLTLQKFDQKTSRFVARYGCTYSRFFDDINVSGKRDLTFMLPTIENLIAEEGFHLNKSKTKFYGKKDNKMVTGITISNGRICCPKAESEAQEILSSAEDGNISLKEGSIELMRLNGLISHISTVNKRAARELKLQSAALAQ